LQAAGAVEETRMIHTLTPAELARAAERLSWGEILLLRAHRGEGDAIEVNEVTRAIVRKLEQEQAA
jgi:hypothetical protein